MVLFLQKPRPLQGERNWGSRYIGWERKLPSTEFSDWSFHHCKFLNFARRQKCLRYHFLWVETRWIFPPNNMGEQFLPVDLKFIHCCFWTTGINGILEKLKPSFCYCVLVGWLAGIVLFHLVSLHQILLGFFHIRSSAMGLYWPVGLVSKRRFVRELASEFLKLEPIVLIHVSDT